MRRLRSGSKANRLANERALASRTIRQAAFSAFAALTALVLIVVSVRFLGAAHPEPRVMDHTGHVLPQEQFREHPRVQQGYADAAEIPHVLDGLYCYCRCSQHSAHYSLLDCFVSAHAARCDICLTEAAIAYQMSHDGRSLDDIRDRIDAVY